MLAPLAIFMLFPSLAAFESAAARGFADHQKEVFWPAVFPKVRLARLVIVSVLRVAGSAATLCPRLYLPALVTLQHQPANVPLCQFAPLVGRQIPVE
jgi:hypothetical protein